MKNIIKQNVRLLIAILLTLVFVFFVIKNNNWLSKYLPGKLHIDDTELILKEINKEQKLYTAISYHELVIDSNYESNAISINQPTMVLIIKGYVKMGYDLGDFKKENITQKADTIVIKIPNKQIVDVIINPSDIEIIEQKGYWGDATTGYLVEKAKKVMLNSAKEKGIEQISKKSLENTLSYLTLKNKNILIEYTNF